MALATGETPVDGETSQRFSKQLGDELCGGLKIFKRREVGLQRYHYYLGDTNFVSKDLARYQGVTPEKLQSLVSIYFTNDKMSKLIVLPEPKEDAGKNSEGVEGESQ